MTPFEIFVVVFVSFYMASTLLIAIEYFLADDYDEELEFSIIASCLLAPVLAFATWWLVR